MLGSAVGKLGEGGQIVQQGFFWHLDPLAGGFDFVFIETPCWARGPCPTLTRTPVGSVKSWIYQKPCRDFWLHATAAAPEKHAAVFQESIAKPVRPSFPLEFSN